MPQSTSLSSTLEEQETIVRWDRTPARAMLYTASPSQAARWSKRGIDVSPVGARGWQATVPKKAVRIGRLVNGELPARKANPATYQTGNPSRNTTGFTRGKRTEPAQTDVSDVLAGETDETADIA